ncbi:MAG TPA: hypothetical protein VMZ29_13215 [Candidatus Bathyarchaeia archaeon]|nr:hypothetical protein [Candidatus Bathyarchaeia archaeon]
MSRLRLSLGDYQEETKAVASTLLTKSTQTVLLYLLTELLSSAREKNHPQQRVLARKLAKHYNTIYLSFQELQENNYLQVNGETTQTLVQINLDKLVLPSLLMLLNTSLSHKMLTFDLFQIFDEKKQKNQKSIFDDEQINEQAVVILEKKKELAKILAQELLTVLKEAYKTTQQVLDFDDYSVIISQVFETIPEHLGTTLVQKRSFNLPKDINYKNTKLGKL